MKIQMSVTVTNCTNKNKKDRFMKEVESEIVPIEGAEVCDNGFLEGSLKIKKISVDFEDNIYHLNFGDVLELEPRRVEEYFKDEPQKYKNYIEYIEDNGWRKMLL